MSRFTLPTLAAATLLCSFSASALADDMPSNKIMMVTADGKMTMVAMPDKDMMAKMMKSAQVMGEDMAIFVFGTKLYVVKNEKMADGMMSFDYWGIHGTR
jgi:hypothetical protein